MRTVEAVMAEIDAFVYGPKVAPYRGWHDDHRQNDPGPNYLPAMQQVRNEFVGVLVCIAERKLTKCLQLGLGPSKASHAVWSGFMTHVLTIDLAMCVDDAVIHRGMNTHDMAAISFAIDRAPFDFLFIDAGHSYQDVAADYRDYSRMVRRGGLIAFHDALPRSLYPEIEVHKFIEHLPVTIIGAEVGTAVMEVT